MIASSAIGTATRTLRRRALEKGYGAAINAKTLHADQTALVARRVANCMYPAKADSVCDQNTRRETPFAKKTRAQRPAFSDSNRLIF
jgi:hypothetical protein